MNTTFTVKDVMAADSIKVYAARGNELYFICPECGHADYKCSANPEKGETRNGVTAGVWGCVRCGAGGGPLSLHMAENPDITDPKEAAKDLHRLLDNEQTEELIYECLKEEDKKVKEGVKVDAAKHDKVYRAMHSIQTLSPAHRDNLLKRGLTDKDIADGMFFDISNDGYAFCRRLVSEAGLSPQDLDGIAGLYDGYNGKTSAAVKSRGFFCPVWDEDGRIIAGQISQPERAKEDKEKPKYMWYSSSDRNGGVSSGAQCSFLKGSESGYAIVTEGTLKSYVTWCLLKRRVTVISVPGVRSLNNLRRTLINSKVIKKDDVIFEAYDMDKKMMTVPALRKAYEDRDMEKHGDFTRDEYNLYLKLKTENIAKARDGLEKLIRDAGFICAPLVWDIEKPITMEDPFRWNGRIKGIDDFLLSIGEDGREKYHSYLVKKAAAYSQL